MATQADDPPMSVLGLIFFASVIGTLVTVILLVGLYRHGEAREFKEKVIDVPVLSVQSQREQAEQRLSSYGWVDREKDQVHIPIERAMALYLEEQRGKGR